MKIKFFCLYFIDILFETTDSDFQSNVGDYRFSIPKFNMYFVCISLSYKNHTDIFSETDDVQILFNKDRYK